MFNVTVIKMKDIKKYLIGTLITTLVVVIGTKYFDTITDKSKKVQKSFFQNSMVECLEKTVPTIGIANEEKDKIQEEINKIGNENALQGILDTQIGSIKIVQKAQEKVQEEIKQQDIKENEIKQEKVEEKKEESTRRGTIRVCYGNSSNNK